MKKAICQLVKYLMRAYSVAKQPVQKRVNGRISRKLAVWVAEKRYCETESLAQVASEFGVSEEELSYYFSTIVGMRFTTFRKDLRIEEARRLICEQPDMRLLVVANRVGITDKCNFRKQFYEKFGVSPSDWQRKCAEDKYFGR